MADKSKRRTQRGSRHNKKNMRKKIDISDVDTYLESLRHDERTGQVGVCPCFCIYSPDSFSFSPSIEGLYQSDLTSSFFSLTVSHQRRKAWSSVLPPSPSLVIFWIENNDCCYFAFTNILLFLPHSLFLSHSQKIPILLLQRSSVYQEKSVLQEKCCTLRPISRSLVVLSPISVANSLPRRVRKFLFVLISLSLCWGKEQMEKTYIGKEESVKKSVRGWKSYYALTILQLPPSPL